MNVDILPGKMEKFIGRIRIRPKRSGSATLPISTSLYCFRILDPDPHCFIRALVLSLFGVHTCILSTLHDITIGVGFIVHMFAGMNKNKLFTVLYSLSPLVPVTKKMYLPTG